MQIRNTGTFISFFKEIFLNVTKQWKSRFSLLFLLHGGRIFEPDPSFSDSDPNSQHSFEGPCTFRLI
jgi:hypothetical protein